MIKISDAKIANAFFFAVRNTLVADTLEQATRIAYGKVIVLLAMYENLNVIHFISFIYYSLYMVAQSDHKICFTGGHVKNVTYNLQNKRNNYNKKLIIQ